MANILRGPFPVLAVGGALVLLYGLKMASVLDSPQAANCEELPADALPRVVMYGTDWCQFCMKSRWFMDDHDVAYCAYDIEASKPGAQRFQQLGGRAIPLILVGKQRLDGYDEKALRAALQREGLLN